VIWAVFPVFPDAPEKKTKNAQKQKQNLFFDSES